jgi:hypothetical protein
MISMPLRMMRAQRKSLKPFNGAYDALGRAMVLLDNVVEVFALRNHDFDAVLGLGLTDPSLVRSALIAVDDLGKTVVLDGTLEKAAGSVTIPRRGSHARR